MSSHAGVCIVNIAPVGLAKRVRARFLLASTSEVYGGICLYMHLYLLMLLMFQILRWGNHLLIAIMVQLGDFTGSPSGGVVLGSREPYRTTSVL